MTFWKRYLEDYTKPKSLRNLYHDYKIECLEKRLDYEKSKEIKNYFDYHKFQEENPIPPLEYSFDNDEKYMSDMKKHLDGMLAWTSAGMTAKAYEKQIEKMKARSKISIMFHCYLNKLNFDFICFYYFVLRPISLKLFGWLISFLKFIDNSWSMKIIIIGIIVIFLGDVNKAELLTWLQNR